MGMTLQGGKKMHNKGQGALEYLLLIGGAIVVAAIVIVLVTNAASQSGTTAEQGQMSSVCNNRAATAGNPAPICDDLSSVGDLDTGTLWDAKQQNIWNSKTNTCWNCAGTYPSCGANKLAPDLMDTQKKCIGDAIGNQYPDGIPI